MSPIVSDTGPILHLQEADSVSLLREASNILIPPAVHRELDRVAGPDLQSLPWIGIQELEEASRKEAEQWLAAGLLDAGEAEAIALARSLKADWLLTEDAAARLVGESLGLEIHGSLGVVLWAAGAGHTSEKRSREVLEALLDSSLWVSARVRHEAWEALDSIFG